MRHSVTIAIVSLVLIAPGTTTFAASKSPKLARCDGKHRRPVNVYGTILPTVDPASGAVTSASAAKVGVEVFPPSDPAKSNPRGARSQPSDKPLAQVPPISAISPPTSFGSC